MKHLGDITRIHGAGVPLVEVVIGGSPCQDLSVAGKRAGLDGERSGLFMDQIRVIKEMREYDKRVNARTGADVRPRYMVWENVPGAFSSAGGEDFRAVLEETAHIAEKDAAIPRPENGKWQTAGCIMGDGWSIAWRVLDAQFWGVPQRRRRIALVADFGGNTAPEILFERESVSGDSQESGETRERTAGDAEKRARKPVFFLGSDFVEEFIKPEIDKEETNPAICIQGNCIDRADTAGCNGKGWRDDDVSFTLNTIDRPAVYAIDNHPQDSRVTMRDDGVVQTLSKQCGTGGGNVPMCMNVPFVKTKRPTSADDYTKWEQKETANTLNGFDIGEVRCNELAVTYQETTGPLMANSHPGSYTGQDAYNDMLIAKALRESGNDLMREGASTYPITQNLVRRLTPMECERLQGYPDGWTDIGEWVDSKGKKHESSDSARYKSLGNSIALPPWRFVLGRLNTYLKEHTMASLFDGIGGFPLIWQELNGPGKCLWASEIEEFCVAVTKRRFGE